MRSYKQEAQKLRQIMAEYAKIAESEDYEADSFQELVGYFKLLAHDDRGYFRKLCIELLNDADDIVRLGTIILVRECRIRDNIISAILAKIALNQKNMREEALLALVTVGTKVALPQLLLLAEQGYSTALYIVRHMLRSQEEIEQGIAIARKYIGAKDYELREAALFLLQKYSSMEQEAKCILASISKYYDELFIDALKDAPPEIVLEELQELQIAIKGKFSIYRDLPAAYSDLSSTIHVLEQKGQN
jgi:hypothetical protein